ncbi:YcjF family protein [uncultured Methylovirgula sp.]|uniref:YcjF family protein n=1 Tax=uncultured Methylovirgula sp. TaxID=1285960 RepID=UPI0026355EAF|nr:TIGR01620 family protein [uncultured Methylovirgula sp.]
MATEARIKPQAFRLDKGQGAAEPARETFTLEPVEDFVEAEAAKSGAPLDPAERAVESAQRRGITQSALLSWGGLFVSAAGGFILLALSNWLIALVAELFSRSKALGYAALGLGGLALLALAVMAGREIWSIARQSKIAHMHIGFAAARAADDRDAARRLVAALVSLQAKRGSSAAVRANLIGLTKEIVDGRDLIDIAERDLVLPLDREVAREIANAAKRVSMVTAISPRALVDVAFVAAQALRLVRRISEVYGGRPGFFGFLKLIRSVGAHLAITGGVAVGDSLIQQVVGHGIAARLSARLGEGVLNGMLTARVGLSAMAVCRPMPFAIEPPPGIGDVAPFLFQSDKKREDKRKD